MQNDNYKKYVRFDHAAGNYDPVPTAKPQSTKLEASEPTLEPVDRAIYSELIHIAAELARGDGFLSTCAEDLNPRLKRADILKTAERQEERLKDWAYRVRQVADKLPRAASTIAPQQSDGWPSEAASKIADYFNAPPSVIPAIERIIQRCAAPAPSAAPQDAPQQSDDWKVDARIDRSFIAGMKFGWNCRDAENHKLFMETIRARNAEIYAASAADAPKRSREVFDAGFAAVAPVEQSDATKCPACGEQDCFDHALRSAAPSAAIQDEAPRNNEAAIALLNEWLSHPEQEDDGSLDRLKRLIDENRLSDRKFWPELSPSNLSSLARKAAEEIREWLRTGDGEVDANAINEVAAIIERCLSEGEA